MTKAAFLVSLILIVNNLSLGQDATQCSTSSKSSALLQVDRSRRTPGEPVHEATDQLEKDLRTLNLHEKGLDKDLEKDLEKDLHELKLNVDKNQLYVDNENTNEDEEDDPVTMEEVLTQTEPLQDQIDDLGVKVKKLEKKVDGTTELEKLEEELEKPVKKSNKKDKEGSQEEEEEEDEDNEGEADDEEDEEGEAKEDEDDSDGKDEDEEENMMEDYAKDDNPGDRRRRRRRRRKSSDRSYDSGENGDLPDYHTYDDDDEGEYPDWGGLAPSPHWNGLEKVKATDSGPDASWKGKGTGVITG